MSKTTDLSVISAEAARRRMQEIASERVSRPIRAAIKNAVDNLHRHAFVEIQDDEEGVVQRRCLDVLGFEWLVSSRSGKTLTVKVIVYSKH